MPTSIGYGASFGGIAALLAMLNSCASGVTVVNIDNGFGAGYAASQINVLVSQIMKILYLDLFSGIAGDMFIAALLDLGVDLRATRTRVEKAQARRLSPPRFEAARNPSISGVKFDVHLEHEHSHDHARPSP